MENNIKICPDCKESKNYKDFYKDKRRKDGVRCYCKDCEKKRNKINEPKYKETRNKYRQGEKYKEIKINYYLNNKEYILKKNKEWAQTFNGRLASYKTSAKNRNIDWLLTEDEFKSFWQESCFYCDESIETIGIDRVDNMLPYSMDNCRACCSTCNKMKMDLPEIYFIDMINKIYYNLNK